MSLEGANSLASMASTVRRKPLCGCNVEGHTFLLVTPAVQVPPPPRQSTMLGFFSKPVPEPDPEGEEEAGDGKPAMADTLEEVMDARDDVPGWAASGGSTLEVMTEAVRRVWLRDAQSLFTEDERQWMLRLQPELVRLLHVGLSAC